MSKKVTLMLAASVFLSGVSGVLVGAMSPSHAITSVDELSDVNQNHWAYEALRDLVEKYDVIEGYPDGTFRGSRTPTRWEMAAALNALIKAVGRDIARLGAEKADKTDLQTLARLQEQFRNELTALQARTSALEARATAIEAKNEEQDNRLTLLEKTQIHGDFSFGILSDMSNQGTTNGNGQNSFNGIRDGISTLGRLRLTMDVPVKEDNEDSYFGRGDIHARMIAAFGRMSPSGAQQGNGGAFNNFSGYSRISSDADGLNNNGLNSGALTGTGQLRSNLYVENVHYKQHVKSGMPLLSDWFPGMDVLPDEGWETTGDLYLGVVPWRYLYDKSPYRGDELNQFQNNAFVNTPGVAVNYNMPMVAYQWHQQLGSDDLTLDFTTGLGTIDQGDVMGGMNLTYEGRLNYNTSVLGLGWDMPGSFYAGGYHMWENGNTSIFNANIGAGATTNRAGGVLDTNNLSGDDTSALYVGWNQEWYEGIGTTFNYLLSSNGKTNLSYASLSPLNGTTTAAVAYGIRQSLSGVLSVPMAAIVPGWRDQDAFGIGYGLLDFVEESMGGGTTSNRFDDAWEQAVETYYKWQVNDAISVVPSLQLIMNRGGLDQNGFTAVLGLRTNYTF